MSKVLVVDGDRAARDALVTCLKFVGMEAHGAENAAAAQDWLKTGVADVLVLADEIAAGVSTDPQASIVVLTRRPIPLSRVVERVESLIEGRKLRQHLVLTFGALSLDVASGRVSCEEKQVALGHIETRLLAFFIGLPDKVFSRAQLLQRLWPSNVRVEERTVDVHIRRLRLALAHLDCAGYIQTVRCSGYRFSTF